MPLPPDQLGVYYCSDGVLHCYWGPLWGRPAWLLGYNYEYLINVETVQFKKKKK
jgi:hypothetical protein